MSSSTWMASKREGLPEHHSTGVTYANDVPHPLGHIDAQDPHRLCPWTRLPGVHGGPHDRHHAGFSQPF